MQTVFETRRDRLKVLIQRFGSIAALNLKLGWEATNARLSQIQNRSIRSDRGTAYEMGDVTAREIEEKLSLAPGWMDTPVPMANDRRISHAIEVLESMTEAQRDQALKILNAIAEPPQPGTGTLG